MSSPFPHPKVLPSLPGRRPKASMVFVKRSMVTLDPKFATVAETNPELIMRVFYDLSTQTSSHAPAGWTFRGPSATVVYCLDFTESLAMSVLRLLCHSIRIY